MNNVVVRRSKKSYWQQVVDYGSTRNKGDREMKVGGAEQGVKAGGRSYITKKMGVKVGCVGDDRDSNVGKRGRSSTMARYLLKKEEDKRWAVLR